MSKLASKLNLSQVGRVCVTVADTDRAIDFYVDTLGFEKVVDVPMGEAMRWVCVALAISGLATWAWAAVLVIYRKKINYLFIVSTAALGSAFAVLIVNVLVHVLAFRNRGPTALHEGYPLLILFGVTAWMAVMSRNTPDRVRN